MHRRPGAWTTPKKKYATLYSYQDFLAEQHRRSLDALAGAIGMVTASEDGDPRKSSPADLQRFREQVILLRSLLFVEEQMTRTASERYKKALEDHSEFGL